MSVRSNQIEDIYPLSAAQEGILFHALYEPSEGLYMEQFACELKGAFDIDAFRSAWQSVLDHHSVLRTVFVWNKKDRPFQVVLRNVPVPLQTTDAPIDIEEERSSPFDLGRGPLMRLRLAQNGRDSHHFTWTYHHILLDRTSVMQVLRQVIASYECAKSGTTAQLAPVRPFRDYVSWLSKQDLTEAESFWRKAFVTFRGPVVLGIAQHPQSGNCVRTYRSNFPADVAAELATFAAHHRLTVNTVVEGTWALTLGRYSRRRDVTWGRAVLGRPAELMGSDQTVGLFINTLPMLVEVDPGLSAAEWFRGLQRRLIECKDYEYTPLSRIQSWIAQRGEALFDSIFVFLNADTKQQPQRPGSLLVENANWFERTSYPISVGVMMGRTPTLQIDFDSRRFAERDIVQMADCYLKLLSSLLTSPEVCIGALPSVLPEDFFAGPAHEVSFEPSFIQRFEAQVEISPEAIAVVYQGKSFTYRELDNLAGGIAKQLIEARACPDDVVGLLLSRSHLFLASVLGIFKVGCAYLPLDPGHPRARNLQLLCDGNVALVLAEHEFLPLLEGASAKAVKVQQTQPAQHASRASHPRQKAYVIYTSGSTGVPKGAIVELGGMLNHLLAKVDALQLSASDAIAQTASQCFDISVWQFLTPLLVGGRVCIMPPELSYQPQRLAAECKQTRVTILELVPAQLRALLDEPEVAFPTLRWLLSTGEALPHDVANRWLESFPRVLLLNAYGPTECSDDVTHAVLRSTSDRTLSSSAPIGRAVRNTRLYVLDPQLQPVPPGVAGELFIGGAGVGRGYLNDAARTAESFVPDPYSKRSGERLYRSGDLVRLLPGGELDFLGRVDQQVKVHGFRVELCDIESILHQHPSVLQAAVVATRGPSGEQRLAACLVPANDAVSVSAVREYLATKLPSYMVPGVFVSTQHLPLSSNGKLDRRAVALMLEDAKDTAASPQPPSNAIEERLAQIWSDVLKNNVSSVDANFFELGGDSILSIQVVSRATREGLRFTVRQLFEKPTISQLAALISQEPATEENAPLTLLPGLSPPDSLRLFGSQEGVEDSYPLSPMQQGMLFYHQLEPDLPAYNVEISLAIDQDVDATALQSAWQIVLSGHAIFRTSFVTDSNGDSFQAVHRAVNFPIQFEDWRPLPEDQQESLLDALLLSERRRKWNLSQVPLARVILIQRAEEKFHLIWSYHHILLDGWSWPLVLKDIFNAYRALASGSPVKLDRPRPYRDFIAWMRQQDLREAESFWRAELASFKPLPPLAAEPRRQGSADYCIEWLQLTSDLTHQLGQLAKLSQVTVNTVLQSVWAIWLAAVTGSRDIAFGMASSGRPAELAGVERIVGPFINSVPLRLKLEERQLITEFLAQVQKASSEARRYEYVSLSKISAWAGVERGASLFETFLAFQNYPVEPASIAAGLRIKVRNPETAIRTNNPLTVGVVPGTQLSLYLLYDSLLFSEEWITRCLLELKAVLDTVASGTKTTVGALLQSVPARERNYQMTNGREGLATRLKSISSVQPRAVKLSGTGLVSTRVHEGGATRALVIEPKLDGVDLGSWMSAERETIERYLLDYGAVYFRCFGPRTEAAFGASMRSLWPALLDYTEGSTPRSHLGDQIYTSTEYPQDQSIPMHNEMSYTRHWPMKIGFCCVKPSERGGETPIADSREVYRRLDPQIRSTFAEKKVMYVRNYGEGLDVPWQRAFLTDDRAEVERYCSAGGIQCEWLHKDKLRTRQVSQAVFQHPVLKQPVWFNQAHLFHISNLSKTVLDSLLAILPEEDLPRNAYYGDGSPIEISALEEIRRVYAEVTTSFAWNAGDVLLLDNMLVAHGRQPYSGSRKVVVAMADGYFNSEF